MEEIKIRFTGDDAKEAKEAFFDWWDGKVDGDFELYASITLDSPVKTSFDSNTITVRT